MKSTSFLIIFIAAILSVHAQQEPTEYSIEQFYENTRVTGGSFSQMNPKS